LVSENASIWGRVVERKEGEKTKGSETPNKCCWRWSAYKWGKIGKAITQGKAMTSAAEGVREKTNQTRVFGKKKKLWEN